MSHRVFQINELIRHELGSLFLSELEFAPGTLVTIVSVDTAPDLKSAKVWISILPPTETRAVLKYLKRQIGHLQFLLNRQLSIRPLPRLRFMVDETEKRAAEVDALIDEGLRSIRDHEA